MSQFFAVFKWPRVFPGFHVGARACQLASRWSQAVHILRLKHTRAVDEMDARGLCISIEAKDSESYTWKASISCLESATYSHLKVDVHVLSVATSVFEKANQWLRAVKLLDFCHGLNIRSDKVIHNAILSATAKGSSWMFALASARMAEQLQLKADAFGLSALVGANELGWDRSMILLKLTHRQQYSDVCHNSVISACEQMGTQGWQLAISLLYSSLPFGTTSRIGFNSAIASCATSQKWQVAMQHFQIMADIRLGQDEFSFNSLTCSLEKAGKWELAIALLGMMRDLHLVPDEYSYNAAINACKFSVRLQQDLQELKGSAGMESRLKTDFGCRD